MSTSATQEGKNEARIEAPTTGPRFTLGKAFDYLVITGSFAVFAGVIVKQIYSLEPSFFQGPLKQVDQLLEGTLTLFSSFPLATSGLAIFFLLTTAFIGVTAARIGGEAKGHDKLYAFMSVLVGVLSIFFFVPALYVGMKQSLGWAYPPSQ